MATTNQIAYFKAREEARHNWANEVETARHNVATERAQIYGVDVGAETERFKSMMNLEGTKYNADTHYRGTVYSADSSRAASKYSADSSRAAAQYSADSSRLASQYSADQAYLSSIYKANKDYDAKIYAAERSYDSTLQKGSYDLQRTKLQGVIDYKLQQEKLSNDFAMTTLEQQTKERTNQSNIEKDLKVQAMKADVARADRLQKMASGFASDGAHVATSTMNMIANLFKGFYNMA